MTKYLLIYNSTRTASDLMAYASPEEMKAGMDAWMEWKDEAEKLGEFEFGMPIQAVNMVTPEGVTKSENQASGYSFIEAGSLDDLLELLKSHPHLKREGGSIDILEVLPMPGL